MYYGKNVSKSCLVCARATMVDLRNEIICSKKGRTVTPENSCIWFKYDPLKRPVFSKPQLGEFSENDFKI